MRMEEVDTVGSDTVVVGDTQPLARSWFCGLSDRKWFCKTALPLNNSNSLKLTRGLFLY